MARLLSFISIAVMLILQLISTVQSMYTSAGAVKILDAKGIREMERDSGVWMVEFYAPWCGHCKNLAPEWKKAAKALDGVVKVAAVDCDAHKDLAGKFGVQGFPTIKIFGADKKVPMDYNGERTAKAIVDSGLSAARKLVKDRLNGKLKKETTKNKTKEDKPKPKKEKKSNSDVVTLTDDNFEDLVYNSGDVWLVEFYAPWCGHCKALAPEWEQAASDLKGSVRLGALDATEHKQMAANFQVQGFPTIMVLGPTASGPSDAKPYQGERTASAITSFALDAMEKMGGGLKIKELSNQDDLDDFCAGKSSCVISLLPHITEGGKAARDQYLEILEGAAKLVRGKPFKFAWMQGGDQSTMENTFGLTFGYPSVVAVNLDRQRYVVQRGAFSSKSIADFLQEVLQGKQSTIGFEKFPALNTVTPWDGKDVQFNEEIVEDDDILNEMLGGDEKDEL